MDFSIIYILAPMRISETNFAHPSAAVESLSQRGQATLPGHGIGHLTFHFPITVSFILSSSLEFLAKAFGFCLSFYARIFFKKNPHDSIALAGSRKGDKGIAGAIYSHEGIDSAAFRNEEIDGAAFRNEGFDRAEHEDAQSVISYNFTKHFFTIATRAI